MEPEIVIGGVAAIATVLAGMWGIFRYTLNQHSKIEMSEMKTFEVVQKDMHHDLQAFRVENANQHAAVLGKLSEHGERIAKLEERTR